MEPSVVSVIIDMYYLDLSPFMFCRRTSCLGSIGFQNRFDGPWTIETCLLEPGRLGPGTTRKSSTLFFGNEVESRLRPARLARWPGE